MADCPLYTISGCVTKEGPTRCQRGYCKWFIKGECAVVIIALKLLEGKEVPK